ncbi:ribonuclease H-like protein, partial [Microthyrium microscopicum]
TPSFSYTLYENDDGQPVKLHYCTSYQMSERVSEYFVGEEILGFDLEWYPNANAKMSWKENVSLIQIASPSRIALFHIALHKGTTPEAVIPATLRQILESSNVIKTGVAIPSDCTRFSKWLNIDIRGQMELSHFHNQLINRRAANKAVSKGLISLANLAKEYLQMPLQKGEVRVSNWHKALNYEQSIYAANDAYASLCLFFELDQRRKALDNPPARPGLAELKLPI